MENRFEHNQPEEQGWGAYVTPPQYAGREGPKPGTPSNNDQNSPLQASLCARVLEWLPSLLENDGSVRPEQARDIYGHLAVCPGCARDFEEMQRVVAMVETLTPVETPMDFSGIIMQRIQIEYGSVRNPAASFPIEAASSQNFEEAAGYKPEVNMTPIPVQRMMTTAEQVHSVSARTETFQTTRSQTTVGVWERLTLGGILSAVLAFFLSTAWGQSMLSVNVETIGAWLSQMRVVFERVPMLGLMVASLIYALTQVGDLLSETYRTMGAKAAAGFALDVALGATAYYFFIVRRRRGQSTGY